MLSVLVIEIVLTGMFVLVILGATSKAAPAIRNRPPKINDQPNQKKSWRPCNTPEKSGSQIETRIVATVTNKGAEPDSFQA